ncbi:calcium/sodium antiporter [bacterium]|nr:calcium/sodium antiporter [candidate division CSSED10-310 bacterium]
MTVLIFAAGLTLLIVGADLLVRGASKLAATAGIPSLIIGLTIVSWGTSAPELAVSIKAGLQHNASIAMGNVVGSNIFNVFFILGIAAVVFPLSISWQLIRFDVPVMIGVSLLLFAMSANGLVSIVESMILVVLMLAYTIYLFILARRTEQPKPMEQFNEIRPRQTSTLWMISISCVFVIAGLVGLSYGSNLTVKSAVEIARKFNVSDLVIGLTLVSIGTSLPEVVTSIVASIKHEREIAVGNVVGSNIFNILAVIGISGSLAGEFVVPANMLSFDIPVMVGAAVVCLPIFFTDSIISRWEGCILFSYYIAYTSLLILRTISSPAQELANNLVLYFLLPFTGIFLIVSIIKSERNTARFLQALTDDFEIILTETFKKIRRLVILVTGLSILLVGIAMLVLPGPAMLVIPIGLAILGTEFIWAKRLLRQIQSQLKSAAKQFMNQKQENGENQD